MPDVWYLQLVPFPLAGNYYDRIPTVIGPPPLSKGSGLQDQGRETDDSLISSVFLDMLDSVEFGNF